MMISDWFGPRFDVLRAIHEPYGSIHYLYFRMREEQLDKAKSKERTVENQNNALSGNRGRRAVT